MFSNLLWGGGQDKREGEMRGREGEGEEGVGGGRGEKMGRGERKILRARSARRSKKGGGRQGAGGGR